MLEAAQVVGQLALGDGALGDIAASLLNGATQRFAALGAGVDLGLGLAELLLALVAAGQGGGESVLGLAPVVAVPGLEGLRQLAAEAGVHVGALGLPLQPGECRRYLGEKQVDALEVVAGGHEAGARFVELDAVAAHVGRLFDEAAALVGAQAQHLFDQPLAYEGVGALAELGVEEEVVDVAQADAVAVDQVLALSVAVGAAADDDLLEVDWQPAVAVVEDEVDLAHADGRLLAATGEDDVFEATGAERAGALFAEDPANGVGDVALADAVRPDDAGDAGPELEDSLSSEALEPAQLQPL